MSEQLSESLEMYLKAIYLLTKNNRAVHAKEIAKHLGVAKSSVTGALKQLGERNLINYFPYEPITLSKKGKKIAESILERFRILTKFFSGTLSLEPENVKEIACKMEHVIPNHALNRLADYMDYLHNCPRETIAWNDDCGYFYCKDQSSPLCEHCSQFCKQEL